MDENMFTGLQKNVESVVYDFDGCTVRVSKTENKDIFKIEIDPGNWDFEGWGATSFEKSNTSGYQWWIQGTITRYDKKDCCFNNEDKFSINDINKILNHIRDCVEFKKKIKINITAPVSLKQIKTKLMTREEMLDLLNESKLLPSEICKLKYENFKQYCIENEICSCYEFENMYEEEFDETFSWTDTCALCETYDRCHECPLFHVDKICGCNSTFDYMIDIWGRELFIKSIDNMISVLDKSIEYEKKSIHVLTREEMIELYNKKEMTPAEISLMIWKQKENYVRTHKNCTNYSELSNAVESESNCALCYDGRVNGTACSCCILNKIGEICTSGSTYGNVMRYNENNHDEFLNRVHNMVEKLKEAVRYEKNMKME